MSITSIASFIKYYEQTRAMTIRVIQTIPADKVNTSYMPGKFTIAELIKHIAAIERYVFMEVIRGNKPTYKGCKVDLMDTFHNTVQDFNELHRQSLEILKAMEDEDLRKNITTLDGRLTTVGNCFLSRLECHL